MTETQYATYHLAPNFSILPPPHGPLALGSIIDDLKNPDPINQDALVPLSKVYKDTKGGFSASRSRMTGGEFGIWAKAVGIEGLGGETSGNHETSSEETYRFESIDTEYFYADNDYITQAMNKKNVKEFMKGNGYAPVYIVTGLKIARRPAVSVKSGKKRGARGELSISHPEVLPVDLGINGSLTNEATEAMEFQDSEDFVIGIRVKKVKYTLWGRISGNPTLSVVKHDRGATLVGDSNEMLENALEVEEILDEAQAGMITFVEYDATGQDILWLLPDNRFSL